MKKTLISLKRFIDPQYQTLFSEYKIDFKPRYGHGNPPHSRLFEIINSNRSVYKIILLEMLQFKDVFQGIKKASNEKSCEAPSYNNGFLPGLDIFGIYTMLSKYKPETYIEVGSGTSTKVAYKSIRDNNLNTKILSIDPHPRAEIDCLASNIIRKPFESINFDFIFSLKENDILFIDNSHRILPNSDSMVFFLEVLPRLQKGVIVHIHDIYLPYDYPQFMCDRFYSEQYGLAMYLLANSSRYSTIFPGYFISQDKDLSSMIDTIWHHPNLEGVERHGGSFWLKIE
ncbi:MAG TPA: class I SAM-dependent methyltransferase [Lentimicrobium sp.]|nr:class I SAM-dependent methyltransferase [Lentimicrobium sp.]